MIELLARAVKKENVSTTCIRSICLTIEAWGGFDATFDKFRYTLPDNGACKTMKSLDSAIKNEALYKKWAPERLSEARADFEANRNIPRVVFLLGEAAYCESKAKFFTTAIRISAEKSPNKRVRDAATHHLI